MRYKIIGKIYFFLALSSVFVWCRPALGINVTVFPDEKAAISAADNLRSVLSRVSPDSHWPEFSTEKEPRLLSKFSSLQCSGFDSSSAELEALRLAEKDARKDPGLDFLLAYTHDLLDDDDFGSQRQTGTIGLIWDVIDEGMLEQRQLAREIELKRELAGLLYSQQRLLELYPCRDAAIVSYFAVRHLELAKARVAILTPYIELFRTLYFSGKIFVDDLYEVENLQQKNRLLVERYTRLVEGSAACSTNDVSQFFPATLFDVNLPLFLEQSRSGGIADRAAALETEIQKNRNDSFYDIDLQLFAKASIYDDHDTGSGNDLKVGAELRVPLFDGTDRRLKGEEFRIQQKYAQRGQEICLELTQRVDAYRKRLEDVANVFYRGLILEERLRRSFHVMEKRTAPSDVGPVFDVTENLLKFLDARTEMLILQESCYRQALHLLAEAGLEYSADLFKPFSPAATMVRARQGERSVYLWSDTFNRLSNPTILDFCKAKGVGRVLVSAGRKSDQRKLLTFLRSARDKGVAQELMFSANEWIFPENADEAAKRVRKFLALCSNIHLDIEPHTLKDYKSRRQEYWDMYLQLVNGLAEHVHRAGGQLSVSLPTHVDSALVQHLLPMVDRIHVMAYGRTTVASLQKGFKSFTGVEKEKLAVALRPEDFPGERAFEVFIDQVIPETGIKQISIHALNQYLALTGKGNP